MLHAEPFPVQLHVLNPTQRPVPSGSGAYTLDLDLVARSVLRIDAKMSCPCLNFVLLLSNAKSSRLSSFESRHPRILHSQQITICTNYPFKLRNVVSHKTFSSFTIRSDHFPRRQLHLFSKCGVCPAGYHIPELTSFTHNLSSQYASGAHTSRQLSLHAHD